MAVVLLLQWASFRFASDPGLSAEEQGKFTFDIVNEIEWKTYDWRMRKAKDFPSFTAGSSTNLGYVACGDDSVNFLLDGTLGTNFQFGLFWPRQLYGRVVKELKAQGARLVAFDIMFGDTRPDHPPVVYANGKTVDSDRYFANEMLQARNVVLAATPAVVPAPLFYNHAAGMGDIVGERDADGVLRRAKAFREYRIWLPVLIRWARSQQLDISKAEVKPGKIVVPHKKSTSAEAPHELALNGEGQIDLRAIYKDLEEPDDAPAEPWAKPYSDRRVWTMGIVLAAAEMGIDLDKAEIDLERGRITFRSPDGVVRVMPVDRGGHLYIDWSLQVGDPRLTTSSFESTLSAGLLRSMGQPASENLWTNKLVVVGSTATGSNLTDMGPTPLEAETFLMSKHWNIANGMLTGHFVHRTSPWIEALLVVLLTAISGGLTWRLRAVVASFLVLALVVAYAGVAFYFFLAYRLNLPMVLPVAGALGVTHILMVTYRAIVEQNERKRVKSVFSKIVSPDVVNELLEKENLNWGGSRKVITVLFADVRGFTQMTDEVQRRAEEYIRENKLAAKEAEEHFETVARETLDTVNSYLAAIADNVKAQGGTLDKYIGDCVMAFWGAPIPNDRHAAACVQAAIDSQRAMHRLNQKREADNVRREAENVKRRAEGLPPLSMLALLSLGTGINSGTVTVGLMGSQEHILNYTVFGREVNLASRLEGVSGRGRIVISESTLLELRRHAPDMAATCRELPPVKPKGFSEDIRNFEVPWRENEVAPSASGAAPDGTPKVQE